MWFIETNLNDNGLLVVGPLKICVEEGLFLDYLSEHINVNPLYIQIENKWWNFRNPYTPQLVPSPKGDSTAININKPMQLSFPEGLSRQRLEALQDKIIDALLDWLHDEYKKHQEEWRRNSIT